MRHPLSRLGSTAIMLEPGGYRIGGWPREDSEPATPFVVTGGVTIAFGQRKRYEDIEALAIENPGVDDGEEMATWATERARTIRDARMRPEVRLPWFFLRVVLPVYRRSRPRCDDTDAGSIPYQPVRACARDDTAVATGIVREQMVLLWHRLFLPHPFAPAGSPRPLLVTEDGVRLLHAATSPAHGPLEVLDRAFTRRVRASFLGGQYPSEELEAARGFDMWNRDAGGLILARAAGRFFVAVPLPAHYSRRLSRDAEAGEVAVAVGVTTVAGSLDVAGMEQLRFSNGQGMEPDTIGFCSDSDGYRRLHASTAAPDADPDARAAARILGLLFTMAVTVTGGLQH